MRKLDNLKHNSEDFDDIIDDSFPTSSFKYDSINIKSFKVHPYYEKYLKKKDIQVSNDIPHKNINLQKNQLNNSFFMSNNIIFYSNIEKIEKQKEIEKLNRLEKERLNIIEKQKEIERLNRLEKERLEKERLNRLEKERLDKQNRLEKERLDKQNKLEKQKERLEKERLEKERLEKERLEKEKLEKERLEKEKLEKERLNKQKRLEIERLNRLEIERLNRLEIERLNIENINPKVTIIVPMYNVELYIKKCVMSLINQDYTNIEIILVNDNSSDNTIKISEQLKEDYPNKIKLINNNINVGTYISINNAIVNSIGEYITIIGADDIFTQNKVKEQVQILKNKKLVACYCKFERRDYKTDNLLMTDVGESTIMFKREIIDKIGYYDSVRFGGDSEYRDRIKKIYSNSAINIIPKVMYIALCRPNSLTTSGITKKRSIFRTIYKKNYTYWHNQNKNLYVSFPLIKRTFTVPKELL